MYIPIVLDKLHCIIIEHEVTVGMFRAYSTTRGMQGIVGYTEKALFLSIEFNT